ncbi:MAG: cytochrome c maturation protein CcmE [Hoeflea sp.]|uniref:cytochrome c maturation protein CcmE n=1 Tax=Hoeflea sp. TaxID=1940281 RepID=UPI001DC74C99|nr:cytochrome c maturation protein CcmE [Hoeflea sp.]MBU4530154.1 cytochrome c maturation protein CcmE [Alphaproteobacteria bacterium]MBU4542561.1 cytochrome c maturation protein CcmE [Alphaproteobacteria bacterium]MBU4551242.1 cytochrome c maturation protein CcmE [Alphaproteobacteria bacterium]MBV1723065.1 cytochrome c maturation protein CcmE [Hoeflea sp.]MBV1760076.1 cytochrome c maturation protein CcmE [Hoeflea sp.]
MTRKQKRLAIIAAGAVFLTGAAALVTSALREQIVFFNSPTDVLAQQLAPGTRVRLGGLVEEGSVERGENSAVTFLVTDTSASVKVRYVGLLPDLFREGQGVVTEGVFSQDEGTFLADSVLAKHDENYMPKEVADSLKAQGVWKDGDPAPGVGVQTQ